VGFCCPNIVCSSFFANLAIDRHGNIVPQVPLSRSRTFFLIGHQDIILVKVSNYKPFGTTY
jgi:hypothetical protein